MRALDKPPRARTKLVASLKHKKYRRLENLSTVEGNKLISEALSADIPLHSAYFTLRAIEEFTSLAEKLSERGTEVFSISPGEMERISPLKSPPGCLLVYRTGFRLKEIERGLVLGLHRISDPGNLGTILRTADWFGVSRVLLAPESAELHNPLTVRGSMGAVFRLPIVESADLPLEAEKLKKEGYRIIISAAHGGVPAVKMSGKTALFLGDEQGNLPDEIAELADSTITIPRRGGGESLNIAVACGILLYAHNYENPQI